MSERRNTPREKTYKIGRIAFGGSRAIIGCLVRNLSETGACLQFETRLEIPDAFNLVFESGEPSRTCYVMWRKDRRLGVAFS
jgi:PilZ domain